MTQKAILYEALFIPGVLIRLFASQEKINGKAEVIKCNNTRAQLKAIGKKRYFRDLRL